MPHLLMQIAEDGEGGTATPVGVAATLPVADANRTRLKHSHRMWREATRKHEGAARLAAGDHPEVPEPVRDSDIDAATTINPDVDLSGHIDEWQRLRDQAESDYEAAMVSYHHARTAWTTRFLAAFEQLSGYGQPCPKIELSWTIVEVPELG